MNWRALFGIFKNNFWMKIAALGIAAVLWIFVVSQTNPPRIKEFFSVPVTISGTQELKSKGLTSPQDLSQLILTANATVVATTGQLNYLNNDDITLTADLSGISAPGEYKIPVKGAVTAGNVTSVSPAFVMLQVENLVTGELPVNVQLTGNMKTDMYYGEPKLNKTTVTVAAARSVAEKYARAICYLDVEDLTGPVTLNKAVQILDEDGNAMDLKDIEGELPSVIVSIDVYPKKEVPVDTRNVSGLIAGAAEGYRIENVVLDPVMVEVAGPADILDKITKVDLETIVLSEATADVTVQSGVIIPDGVICNPRQVTLTVQISVILENRMYQAMDIQVKNLPRGLAYTLTPQSVDITVTGSQTALQNIDASKIMPFVDLAGLKAGTHTVTIQFENEPDLNAELTAQTASVTVQLKKE